MPEIALRQYENEIDHLIEEARYLEALAHTRHILRQHPRYIGAYYLLGKTMLEADQPELAIDMFQRALNADPEHLMARIGLTMAHQRVDNLNAAIWNLERAVELNPGDADLIDELRQLYGRRDGFEPERVPLNRAGLARLYMRGNRPGRAVEELRALLAENPQRLDLRLALAEAYWRDDQIVQAADTCQVLLDDARYCLKANLLLGALWVDSGQEEGQTYLNRAQEIDLENTLANEMFGAASPLKPREVSIERLTFKPDTLDVDQQAKWFKKLETASVSISLAAIQPEVTESEARLVDITAGLEAQIEIPDWLRELGTEEDGALSWMADIGAEVEAAKPIAETPMPDWLRAEGVKEMTADQELPDWLSAAEPEEATPEVEDLGLEEDIAAETMPDWLSELAPTTQVEEGAPVMGVPDWLQALEPTAPAAEEIPLSAERLPDWLSELKHPGEAAEMVEGRPSPEVAPSEEVPDWLQSLQPTAPIAEEVETVKLEELPDWMGDFGSAEETTEQALATEEGALPDWLAGFQTEETAAEAVVPTEEAPDWLGELEATSEVVTEETAPGAGVPDWLSELQPVETRAEEALAAEELPDWLNEFQPVAQLKSEAETVEEDLLDWLGEIPAEEVIATAEETSPERLTLDEEVAEQLAEEPASALEEASVAEGFFGWEAFGEEITEVEAAPLAEEEGILDWESLAEQIEEGEGEIAAAKPEPVAEGSMPIMEETPAAEGFFGWEAFGEEITEIAATARPIEIEEGLLDWESLTEQLEEAEGETAAVAPIAEGDDALAWLESLAVGAAEEIGAEAIELEPLVEAPAADLEEAPLSEGFFGWEAFGEEIAEVEAVPLEATHLEKKEEDILNWESLAEQLEEGEVEPVAPAVEGDLMSGDDALAWLESLAVGKEEELRAQGEADTQARVAEILGHKPEFKPTEPEPLVEEPVVVAKEVSAAEGFFGWEAFGEEIAEVETPTPAIEEVISGDVESIAEGDFLSGDDALAWLGSLAAGKEDELRAQAEVETQARIAEILGRKPEVRVATPAAVVEPEPVVEKPTALEAPIEPEVAVEVPIAEGDFMSGDDALAWLSSFAVGKEDELRAQAEVETQARVAEILGRKPGSKAPEKPGAPEAPTPKPVVAEAPAIKAPAEIVEEVVVVAPEAPLTGVELGEKAEYAGLLAQARAAWQAGDVETALARYGELIQVEARLDDVIADLQEAIAEQPDNAAPTRSGALLQLLGDAYIAHGMIDQAIKVFNQAVGLL